MDLNTAVACNPRCCREGKYNSKTTDIHTAVYKNDLETVKKHVQNGCDINATTKDGRTPLFVAACFGRLAIAKFLIKNKCDPNICDAEGSSPLHEAINKADIELAKVLVQSNSKVDGLNKKSQSPLYLCAVYDYVDIAKVLLSCGADVNLADGDGRTPLLAALEDGSQDVARLLMSTPKCCINQRDNHGTSALYLAVHSENLRSLDLAKQLITSGYKVESDLTWLSKEEAPGLLYPEKDFYYKLLKLAGSKAEKPREKRNLKAEKDWENISVRESMDQKPKTFDINAIIQSMTYL